MLMLEVKKQTVTRGISTSKALDELLEQRRKILGAKSRPAGKTFLSTLLENTIGNRASLPTFVLSVFAAALVFTVFACMVSAALRGRSLSDVLETLRALPSRLK